MEDKLNSTLDKYFKRLSQVGYIPDKDVFSIVVLTYITELQKEYKLTVEQKSIINKALSCIQGNCLIPYDSCKGTCI